MSIKLAIIIPCYNEEENIGKLLLSLRQLKVEGVEIYPLPVNDCSKDNTLTEIKKHTRRLLNLPINLGIGGAVQSGFKYALKNNFDIAIQVDGDGQHPVEEIKNLILPLIQNKADVVIGSRFIQKQGFQSTTLRRTGIQFFKHLLKFLTGIKITDSTSGFRALNKKALTLVCDYYPDDYPEPEALVLYALNHLTIQEIPVQMHERMGGKSSIGAFSSVYYMIKVSLGILFIYIRLKFRGKRNTI